MTDKELGKWAEGQVQALIDAGISPLEAQGTVNQVLALLPDGADPTLWMLPLGDSEITEADIAAARAAWYETAPAQYARLLDAREVANG